MMKGHSSNRTPMAAKKPGTQTTVTLKHLAQRLSESHELSKKRTESVLGDLVDLVTKHLKKGDRVRIGGLGIQIRNRAERMGRKPATGGPIPIKRTKVVGTTPDGVKILRPAAKPKHFTSKEVREAVSEAKKVAS
jgi:DNA-binding protein HU-beta